jgi:hypothetical protein
MRLPRDPVCAVAAQEPPAARRAAQSGSWPRSRILSRAASLRSPSSLFHSLRNSSRRSARRRLSLSIDPCGVVPAVRGGVPCFSRCLIADTSCFIRRSSSWISNSRSVMKYRKHLEGTSSEDNLLHRPHCSRVAAQGSIGWSAALVASF